MYNIYNRSCICIIILCRNRCHIFIVRKEYKKGKKITRNKKRKKVRRNKNKLERRKKKEKKNGRKGSRYIKKDFLPPMPGEGLNTNVYFGVICLVLQRKLLSSTHCFRGVLTLRIIISNRWKYSLLAKGWIFHTKLRKVLWDFNPKQPNTLPFPYRVGRK